MFKRRFASVGKLRSDEGSTISYGHKSVRYIDQRGNFEFGFEDAILLPEPHEVRGTSSSLNAAELKRVLDCVMRGLEAEGHSVRIWSADTE